MKKKPVTLDDWRDIYCDAIHYFGEASFRYLQLKALNCPEIIFRDVCKRYWQKYFRLKRIDARKSDVEEKLMDFFFDLEDDDEPVEGGAK